MTMIARMLAGALVICCAGLAVYAQTPSTRIRGTIQSVEGSTLSVSTREGTVVKIALNDPLTVLTVKKVELSAVTAGTYVGTAAQPGPNGELTALEVLVFPESGRGTAEGHSPWDLAPNSSMTNANVAAVEQTATGTLLTLSYKGDSVNVRVSPEIPVVTPAPAAREDLKPGQAVFCFATRAPDGTFSAGRIYVAKDGVAPPM